MIPVVIGSRALWCRHVDCSVKDFDYISHVDLNLGDCTLLDEYNNREFIQRYVPPCGAQKSVYYPSENPHYNGQFLVPSLLGLKVLKFSQLWREETFDKCIAQFHKYYADVPWTEEDIQFGRDRAELIRADTRVTNPKLTQTNEDFFDDAVDKEFDHDYLHTLVAFNDRPIYMDLKRDQSKAWCERDLWEVVHHEEKLKCIAEECYVIALERFIVPSQMSPKRAYYRALKKVCTTLTSGWFREYAQLHYPEICDLFDLQKIQRVQEILNENV